jgi:hypothetical protein
MKLNGGITIPFELCVSIRIRRLIFIGVAFAVKTSIVHVVISQIHPSGRERIVNPFASLP